MKTSFLILNHICPACVGSLTTRNYQILLLLNGTHLHTILHASKCNILKNWNNEMNPSAERQKCKNVKENKDWKIKSYAELSNEMLYWSWCKVRPFDLDQITGGVGLAMKVRTPYIPRSVIISTPTPFGCVFYFHFWQGKGFLWLCLPAMFQYWKRPTAIDCSEETKWSHASPNVSIKLKCTSYILYFLQASCIYIQLFKCNQ